MIIHQMDIYGAANTYAFSRMVRPACGASLKIEDGQHYFVKANADGMLPNADPNGGAAVVLSVQTGKSFTVDRYARASVFAEYQHLQYGALYNNGAGGGVSATITYHRFFISGTAAVLYRMSGDVGYHLLTPGNDYIFSGKMGYRLTPHCSPYLFIAQQRYIGNGNALTSQSVGAGIKYRF
ncbi:hypothetical protein BBC27_08085 [Acidithiobacillus ferrivorans]|uniref:Outer membrane protein beta-barrel domain-containing protein n=2 Tax=Acidithiobacillus ferrivorans TaxID=160808 RepID=A0A1B9C0C0_9PROT|nr:hypothetical protein BBC27_08085 [Acidithiobacillus ferrivorans]